MKHIKLFENTNLKIYKNLNFSDIDPSDLKEHLEHVCQVPFKLIYDEMCFNDDDDEWAVCFNSIIYYDYISDSLISKYINSDLSDINIDKSWEAGIGHYIPARNESLNDYHAKRIAKIAKEIQNNKPLTPIQIYFDIQSYRHDIPNNIEDGNHRMRALEYLKYDCFPASIYGSHSKYLIEYCNKITS